MKRILLPLLALIPLILSAATYRPEDVPNVHIQDSTRFVSDPDGGLSPQARAELDAMLRQCWQQTTAEPTVVVIDDMADGYDETSFANDLFNLWKIGKQDTNNGLLLLFVKNPRRYAVRTGYGLEGIIPDGLAGSMMRRYFVPKAKEGDFDGGVLDVTRAYCQALSDPVAAEEIRSKISNNAGAGKEDWRSLLHWILYFDLFMALAMLLWVGVEVWQGRKQPEAIAYRQLASIKPVAVFTSIFGLGIPLPALLLCLWQMKRLRTRPHVCPNCQSPMQKLDEETDNLYLTPAQDLEEKLNSVDYDVWLCPNCGEKDVIPFPNRRSPYQECPQCGARACLLTADRILRQPTQRTEGLGEKIYTCRNCHRQTRRPYSIAKLATGMPIIIGGGGFGSGGGGGFGGGSFGGGITGGGGASGGW